MKQIRLNLVLPAYGHMEKPGDANTASNIEAFASFAQRAERVGADGLFLADSPTAFFSTSLRRPARGEDPVVLLAALAARTQHIGLVATAPANQGEPAYLARQLATLHQLSTGRAAWNVTTQSVDPILRLFSADVPDAAESYQAAEEFLQIVRGLWESFPPSAALNRWGEQSIDFAAVAPVRFQGNHYRSFGVLAIPGLVQGETPVIFHAGASQRSREFAVRWADAYFIAAQSQSEAQHRYAELARLASEAGRTPPLVLPGLSIIVGATQADAEQRAAERQERSTEPALLERLANRLGIASSTLQYDQELPYTQLQDVPSNSLIAAYRNWLIPLAQSDGLTVQDILLRGERGGHGALVGTPERIAEHIIDWVDSNAADGFNVKLGESVSDADELSFAVFEELQNRGRFRTRYASKSYRDHLGLDRGQ